MEHILTNEPISDHYTVGSILLGETNLYFYMYYTGRDVYKITYISNYPILLNTRISDIGKLLTSHYQTSNLKFKNVCGINAERICGSMHTPGVKFGIIFIHNWMPKNVENIELIESEYGKSTTSIGASYHAISYAEITMDGNTLYVAIETTICPIQFYVGNTMEELTTIICERYQCLDFYITFNCDNWFFDFSNTKFSRIGRGNKNKRIRIKTHKIFKKKNKHSKKKYIYKKRSVLQH